jgi:hypothetical protein
MNRPAIIKLNEGETRSSYLVRVINKFMDSTSAGSETIIYDEAKCDGMCLADDVSSELLDLKKQCDDLLAALKCIRDQLREHPTYLGDECTEQELDDAGGDSAFITWNCHIANEAISKAE